MFFTRKLWIAVLMWVLLSATSALAMSHQHGDHQHQNSVVSPFDGQQEVQPHCVLRGHTHQGFCPHSKHQRDQTTRIAADCGGKTSGAVPRNIESSKNLVALSTFAGDSVFHAFKKVIEVSSSSHLQFLDTSVPPPKFI